MKFIFLFILFLITACSNQSPIKPQFYSSNIYVYENQYILERKGDWCDWYPGSGINACDVPKIPGTFVSLDGRFGPVQLISTVNNIDTKIVPYDANHDKCLTEYQDLDCSPNYVLRVNDSYPDPHLEKLWGLWGGNGTNAILNDLRVSESENVVIAVLDTGIDIEHPDLQDNIWKSYNAISGGKDITDVVGHGTHVAGTACAVGGNGIGIAGVTWKCKILGIKFLGGKDGSGALYDAVKGVRYVNSLARKHKDLRFVINASFGGGGYSSSMNNAIRQANSLGVLFVAAAGNEHNNNDRKPSYPANYKQPNVISVAAIDKHGRLANFSNYGRKSVHIAAPGVDIYSTLPKNEYTFYSGTSMAAPHVAGAIALLWAKYPRWKARNIRVKILKGRTLRSLRGKTLTSKTLDLNG